MATGASRQPGGVVAPANPGAVEYEWASLTGIHAHDPLMQGSIGPYGGLDPDLGRSRIVTLPSGESPAAGHQPAVFDDWRDLFDFRHSPAPYVLLLAFAAIGLVAVRLSVRGGPASASAGLG